ncbi:MAG: DNA gyrase subunit A [Elusimicrobiota bacterium]
MADSTDEPKNLSLQVSPRNIEDEMKESYMDYAMSVIVGRALPDVRDGLKPVHRRILFTMKEMGLVHNKPYKKSARVVGDCFVKDTMVVTQQGLLPIQDIQRGDFVYTQNGLQKVSELYEMPKKELIKISLDNGVYNVVTQSQMFKVIDANLQLQWKEAKELTENDYIVMRSVFPEIKEDVPLSCPNGFAPVLNTQVAYLLGQLISDGWVEKGYNRGKGFRIGFCSSCSPVIKKIQKILKAEFGYEATIEEKRKIIAKAKTLYSIRINSSELNNFILKAFGLENVSAPTKFIPNQIFNSPRKVIFNFISGLIDGDGSIHKERNVIHYGSVSEKLIDRLQVLLQCLGIVGRKYSDFNTVNRGGTVNGREVKGRNPFHSLEFSGRNAALLAVQLNLIDTQKNGRLKKIISSDKDPGKYGVIPFAGQAAFAELTKKHIGSGWFLSRDGKKFRMGIKYPGGSKIRYSKDLKVKNLAKSQIEDWRIKDKLGKIGSPLAEIFNNISDQGLYFIKVKNLETLPAEKTFDIQVEKDHEFIANGMLSHNCLGKYHPHGDMAVYDAMVRMAQEFSLRYTLVEGQGNFGSIDGDPPAAMRYTEVRLDTMADQLLNDIDKNTVDFTPNYDGSMTEPVVLPALLPNLLVNGSSGIAVGMATNIPPHNLGEIIDGIFLYIDNPEIEILDLMKVIKGPDFPTAGVICGKKGIRDYFQTGRGSLTIRAVTEIEEIHGGKEAIIIRELPYQVNKAVLLETIAGLVREKKLDDISDLRDESDRDGIRVVIELKRDANTQIVLNQLYKHTQMETSFGVIMLALVGNRPRVLNLKEILACYLDYRKSVIIRRTQFELEKAEARAHILEGLKIALDNLNKVIKVIRESKDVDLARINLMNEFGLSKIQAQAILDMRLHQLTGLERKKIEDEYLELIKTIERLRSILADPKKILAVIKEELQELRKKFADERRTKIIAQAVEMELEDLIQEEDVVATISHAGYIKRLPVSTYQAQRRGGKGITGMTTREEDFVEDMFVTTTHAYLLLFTNLGRIYWIKVYEIPETGRTAKGKAIVNLVRFSSPEEKITTAIPIRSFEQEKESFLLMATKQGVVKKTMLAEYSRPRPSGIIGINLDEGDSLIGVEHIVGKEEIILATKQGMAVRFPESQIRSIGRGGRGVKGITLRKGDEVVGMEAVSLKDILLTATENGYGKRTEVSEYRIVHRGGIGVHNIKCSERNGLVVGIKKVENNDEIMLMTAQGMTIRLPVKGISVISRNTQGVRLVRLEEGDKLAAIAHIAKEEVKEAGQQSH